MTKALAKALLICIFPWPFGHGIKSLVLHGTTITVLKSIHCAVKPGFALTIHSPRGTGFLMTYLDLLVLELALFYISWPNCKVQTNESRIPVCSFAGMGKIITMDYRNGPKSVPLGTFYVF